MGDLANAREADNKVADRSQTQVLGLTNAVRDACEARGGTEVAVAEGLGIYPCGYGTTHPELSPKIESLRSQPNGSASLAGHREAGAISWLSEQVNGARRSPGPSAWSNSGKRRRGTATKTQSIGTLLPCLGATLEKANVDCRSWDHWVFGDRTVRIGTGPDAAVMCRGSGGR